MELLITYDVDTTTRVGERRLRQVARVCEGIGHRVQKSVFEVTCSPADRLRLEAKLLDTIDQATDSVRIYQLDRGSFDGAKHLGAATRAIHVGPLVL